MRSLIELFAERLPAALRAGERLSNVCLPTLTGSADAFVSLCLAQASTPRVVLTVTSGIPLADRVTDDLNLLTRDKAYGAYETRILEFPPLTQDDKSALGMRLKTLAALRAWSTRPYPVVLVASLQALATPLHAQMPEAITLAPGAHQLNDLVARLTQVGYTRTPLVYAEGEFSVRGGILDVWSPGEEFPVRAEFFGDDLESVRSFNPSSQRSIERLTDAALLPVATLTDSGEQTVTLLDLLPIEACVVALDHNAYTLPPTTRPVIYVGDPAPAGIATADLPTTALPGFTELAPDEAHHPELFEAARGRLAQHLEAARARGDMVFALDELAGGFELPGERGLIVVTKADRVFTKRKLRVRAKPVYQGERLNDFDDLKPGEYVVHVDYGIGRYLGAETLDVNGQPREVFTIEYADGGKLHVPATHAHLLSRYVGVKGAAVHLHRLDGKRWDKEKHAAQKAVADLAASLLETQARREVVPGYAFAVPCEGLEAFEAAFPYDETPDQASAISAIKDDLSRAKPMDRLICGDAGYGKTEVAMRAAYISAMNGKQVAVLAPTTVLAEQHFETFTARFDGTPIRIESLSRFQSGTTHEGTFKRLANGACDIVIGTHAILSKRIAFHDLGLIIIDEEQRFGVRQKEFLKRLRATADILTLSATPIPRTLYLSMTGARDLSLLRTPPRDRVAVDTRVVRDSDETVHSAIERELARGGQVFFLHNRVMSIGRVEKRLKALCPKARILVAHGQMDTRTLAAKMRAFERGEYDILLSTTIIESGIDIPRANTILIDQTDRFGMADLYQLRGRVGRSARQGYAYFLLPASGLIDSEARERLDALKRHGGLGSGFNLALRDLELRGAGNLLGSQQSGHIASVGFTLYCQLLQRTIAQLRGEKVRDVIDVQLNLDFITPHLPPAYIADDAQRLNTLKRFAEVQDFVEFNALNEELRDRFGAPPPEVLTFLKVAELRLTCARAGIGAIDAKDNRALAYTVGRQQLAQVIDLAGTPERKLRDLLRAVRRKGHTPDAPASQT